MLTLEGSLRIGAFTVYRDVTVRGAERALTSLFYVVPGRPRLARGAAGPALQLLWYRALDRADDGAPEVKAGGLLSMTIELGLGADERSALRDAIAAEVALPAGEAPELLPLPITRGEIAVSFAGETAGELVERVGGAGPMTLAGTERATVVLELSRDGAALFARALEAGQDLVHARFDLWFQYHLDTFELRIHCDGRKARDVAAELLAAGPLDPAALRGALETRKIAGVELITAVAPDPELAASLQALGQRLLEAALSSALFDDAERGGSGLRDYDPSRELTLNHTFSAAFPAELRAVLEGPIALDLSAAERAACIAAVDVSRSLRPLVVSVVCSIDFAAGVVSAAHLWIVYEGTADDGAAIRREGDFLFKEGASAWTFRADTARGERRYRYRVEVTYEGGERASIEACETDETLLVIGPGHVGVLDVTVTLGDVPLDAVRAAVVEIEYPPKQLSRTMILDGAKPSERWQAALGAPPSEPYRYRVAWLGAGSERVEDDWKSAAASRLFLDAPRARGTKGAVHAVSAGDFTGLAQIGLDLREGPGAAITQLGFSHPGEEQIWKPTVESGELRYQARRTLVYDDGVVRALDWTDETTPILVVRDLLRVTVVVVPRLLDFDGEIALALLSLEYDDGARVQRGSLVIRGRADEPTWSYRAASAERRAYRYKLTLVSREGARRAGPWRDREGEVLVLRAADSEE